MEWGDQADWYAQVRAPLGVGDAIRYGLAGTERGPSKTMIGGARVVDEGPRTLAVAEYAMLMRDRLWIRPVPLEGDYWRACDVDILHVDGLVTFNRSVEGGYALCESDEQPDDAEKQDGRFLAAAMSTARRGPHCARRHGARDLAARVRLDHERGGTAGAGASDDPDNWPIRGSGELGPWPEIRERRQAYRRCSCEAALSPWNAVPEVFHAPRPGRLVRYFSHSFKPARYACDALPEMLAKVLGRGPARPFRADRIWANRWLKSPF
jgi:hypothetical protein